MCVTAEQSIKVRACNCKVRMKNKVGKRKPRWESSQRRVGKCRMKWVGKCELRWESASGIVGKCKG